jgi:hypothetical protein
MVGAHASFTLTEDTLAACADAASATGCGIHVHVAEDAFDEDDCRARFGISVMERLARAGVLDERSLLAHGVHLTEPEIAIARAAGATLAHNPRSNMHNAVGRAPLRSLGERVVLGTDGIGGDMFEESRVAYLRAHEDGRPDPRLGARPPRGRGRLAGRTFEPLLGRIEAERAGRPRRAGLRAAGAAGRCLVPGHWVFGLSARAVRDVIVAGDVVVRDRQLELVGRDWVAEHARVERRACGPSWTRSGSTVRPPRGGGPMRTHGAAAPDSDAVRPSGAIAADVAVDLSVEVCGLRFPNPVLTAAGPPVRDGAAILACAAGGAGGLVAKTISRTAAVVPTPNMAEIPPGFLNGERWSELPPERWLERELPLARQPGAADRQPRLHGRRHRRPGAARSALRRRRRAVDPLHR